MDKRFLEYNLYGYEPHQAQELRRALQELDFKEDQPSEMGGGGEIIHQILLYLSLHYENIVDNVIANSLIATVGLVMSKLYKWQKANKPVAKLWYRLYLLYRRIMGKKVVPAVELCLYHDNGTKSKMLTLAIDREYSKEELEQLFNEAETIELKK